MNLNEMIKNFIDNYSLVFSNDKTKILMKNDLLDIIDKAKEARAELYNYSNKKIGDKK